MTLLHDLKKTDDQRLEFLWLELTNRCNLQCTHCYAESGPYEPLSQRLNHEDWLAILQDARKSGCKQVQFIGGEPLLYPRLHELVRSARGYGFEFIEIFTNGTRLTQADLAVFKKSDVQLAFSYYSSDLVTHDAITKVRNSGLKTRAAIKAAIDAGLTARVGLIVMEENKSNVETTIQELNELGVKNIGLDYVRGIGRGSRNQPTSIAELCGNCWKGRLAINSKGEIAGCVFSHFWNIGHVDQGLNSVLASKSLGEFRDKVRESSFAIMNGNGCQPDCLPEAPKRPCFPDRPCRPDRSCRPDNCNPYHK